MNITTRHTGNANGRGGVVATGQVDGKTRRKTVAWDHARSAAANHASAAAQFVQRNFNESQWDVIAFNTSYTLNDDQSYTWTVHKF